MNDQLLDADYEPKTMKPWKVWKVGFGFGIVSALLGLVFSLNPFPVMVPFLVPMILFCLFAQVATAAFGNRHEHFARIWTSGTIVILCNVLLFTLVALIKTGFSLPADFSPLLGLTFGVPLLSTITAFLFWIFPGKLGYFKNKIEQPSGNLPQNP